MEAFLDCGSVFVLTVESTQLISKLTGDAKLESIFVLAVF